MTTVTIGSQIWTDKNLEVTTYRNGDPITYAANAAEWNDANNAEVGAWCYYLWDAANGPVLGKLYNWYAVNDSRGLAPSGYHVPTATEYNTLASNAAISLKANSTEWNAAYQGTNTTGFAGLPGGNKNSASTFEDRGTSGWFWTSTSTSSTHAPFRLLHQTAGFIQLDYPKKYGMSVRLVKD